MDKRDQINVVLDADVREALNELRREDSRIPSVSTIVREAILELRAKRAAEKPRKSNGNGHAHADYVIASIS